MAHCQLSLLLLAMSTMSLGQQLPGSKPRADSITFFKPMQNMNQAIVAASAKPRNVSSTTGTEGQSKVRGTTAFQNSPQANNIREKNSDHENSVHENSVHEKSVPSNRSVAVPLFFLGGGSPASPANTTALLHGHRAPASLPIMFFPSRDSNNNSSLLPETGVNITSNNGTNTTPSVTTTTTNTTTSFNDTLTTRRQHFRTYQTPACVFSSSLDLCEEDDEYDEDVANAVRAALKDPQISALLRANTAVNEGYYDSVIADNTAGSAHARFGPDDPFEPTCGVQRQLVTPRRVQTENGTWAFAINQDDIIQHIFVEKCIRQDSSCSLGFSTPPTVHTKCKQVFITHPLYTLNDLGQNVTLEAVLIPSCCTCYVSKSSV